MDFPGYPISPLFIHSLTNYARAWAIMGSGTFTTAVFNWPAANQAIYIPIYLPFPYLVKRVFWVNGSTASGNMDFGIYVPSGAKIYSTGSVAQSGASARQYVTPASAFLLTPGQYYMALANDGTTNRGFGGSGVDTGAGVLGGLLQQASALPLPDPATMAAWASTGLPLCGITKTASGF